MGYELSKQGEIFCLSWTHWSMLAHKMTRKMPPFSVKVFSMILHLLLFFFYDFMTNNLHLFYIDSAESKKTNKNKLCLFEIRTENGVLPEKRFVGLHSLMCHAEREKTLSRASVMPCGSGTCSATLEKYQI